MTEHWIYESKSIPADEYYAGHKDVVENGWQFVSKSNGVVYLRKRYLSYQSVR
jgi:hypothetical protein